MPDYFTIAELRALPDVDDTVKYTTAKIEDAAAHIVGVIEREVGTSFISRTIVDEPHDGSAYQIFLDNPYVLSVTSATEDGVAVTDSLSARAGVLRRYSGTALVPWAPGYGNILVTYEAGYTDTPPDDIKRAALKATRLELISSAADSSANARRTSLSGDMGVESFVIAGQDRPTGYPEIDATILSWKQILHVAGVA